jgi:hypothetical protein
MKYLVSIFSKLILLPFAVIQFIFAYGLFIISPDLHKFSFKMVK